MYSFFEEMLLLSYNQDYVIKFEFMEKIINIFGDSIAWGAGDEEKGGWVNRLREYLDNKKSDYFGVYNLGIAGDDTSGVVKRFSVENASRKPDTIIIAIGINDSRYINSKDNPQVSLESFEENLVEIIKQARGFTKEVVFIGLTNIDESKLMPIPWNPTAYHEQKDVAAYNSKIKELCEKNKIMLIELQGLLDNSDLEDDGLHPNAQGHEKMFQKIKDFLIDNKII